MGNAINAIINRQKRLVESWYRVSRMLEKVDIFMLKKVDILKLLKLLKKDKRKHF